MRVVTLLLFLFCSVFVNGQEANLVVSTPQRSGTTIEATNSITLLPGFTASANFIARIVEENWFDVVVGSPYAGNENLNWIRSSSYDLAGNLTASGVSYFNSLGKGTQSHSLDIKTGKIWVNEVKYDEFGRAVFSTLSAPVGTTYGYRSNFIKKANGATFSQADALSITNNTAAGIIGNQENSLGWYYSENNTSEPYQDITAFPFSKTVFSSLNPGLGLRTLGGNKVRRTPTSTHEEWLQSYTFSMPLSQELFYAFGKDAFPERELVITPNPSSSAKPRIGSSNYYFTYDVQENCKGANENGIRFFENWDLQIGFTYKMKIKKGDGTFQKGYFKVVNKRFHHTQYEGDENYQRQNSELYQGERSFLADNNIAYNCPSGKPYYIQGQKTVVRDVHGIESVVFKDSNGNVLASARSGNEDNSTRKKYQVVSPIGPQGYVDIHIPVGCGGPVVFKGAQALFKVYDLITERLITTHGSGSINLQPGMYRIEENNTTHHKNPNPYVTIQGGSISLLDESKNIGVAYHVNYYDYSLQYYDKANRLTSSVQPVGFDDALTLTGVRNHTVVSTFSYNSLGQLLSTTSPDEGTAVFKYSKDGQIRFSQNSKQAAVGEFSYTDYDPLGRPVESGVCTGNFSNLHPDVLAFSGNRKEQHFTTYDLADPGLSAILTANNLSTTHYKQTFVAGNVSKTATQNPNSTTTWYGYDVYGRVQWMLQDIPGLGLKTIDYEYDFATGQVTKVLYQKDHAPQDSKHMDETFVHQYTYNVAGQLYKVATSTDNTTFTQQAKYKYYETGALKRIEVAENVQGVDYVYNLNGQLKAINHPSITTNLDPGKDGSNGMAKDLFGFAIDYYNGDYARINSPTPVAPRVSSLIGTNQFNGNIKATRWATSGLNVNNQSAQVFTYNKNNWLQQASFGVAQNTGAITLSNDYKVSNISYDANGNIQTLHRTKNTENGSNAMDALRYHYKITKPNQLDRVADAVTSPTAANDLKTQAANNYVYNGIGQLVANTQDQIAYTYNASGLVTTISEMVGPRTWGEVTPFPLFLNDFTGYVPPTLWNPSPNDWHFAQGGGSLLTNAIACEAFPKDFGDVLSVFIKNKRGASTLQKSFVVVPEKEHAFSLDFIRTDSGMQLLRGGDSLGEATNHPITLELKTASGTLLGSHTFAPASSYPYCKNYALASKSFTFTPPSGTTAVIASFTLPAAHAGDQFIIDNVKMTVLTKPAVQFTYNDKGFRVKKESFLGAYTQTTYYVRDAAGSSMAIINMPLGRTANPPSIENPIYGLSRLGIYKKNTNTNVYQFTDHLGNIRAVASKNQNELVSLLGVTDYYPGGMAMPGRMIRNGQAYRYGYQGEFAETDPETGKPAFQLRLYDPRINRWLTTDPYGQHASPYMSMGNSWPNRVDPDGGCDKPDSSCGWFKRLFYSQDSENQWDFWQEYGITSMDQVLEGIHDRGSLRQIAIEYIETENFAQSLQGMGMDVSVINDRREAMNSNINFMVGSALPSGKLATVSKAKGRLFYVGEGAEELARGIASQSKYKTIFNTWYGKVGNTINPLLNKEQSRGMWKNLSKVYANSLKVKDNVITVFGRHHATGLHTLPIKTKAVWKTTEFPILDSKGIDFMEIFTK